MITVVAPVFERGEAEEVVEKVLEYLSTCHLERLAIVPELPEELKDFMDPVDFFAPAFVIVELQELEEVRV